MSLPPKDIEPGDLFQQIIAMPRPHRLVPFPRKKPDGEPVCEVAIQVLTQAESMAASAATEKWVRETLKGDIAQKSEARRGYEDLYNNRGSIEVLMRACRRATDLSKPFFRTKEDISKYLSVDEVGVLMAEYMRVSHDLGPIAAALTEEEMEAWMLTLANGGEAAVPLSSLSWGAVSQFMIFLARRALSYSMATDSPTTPRDDE